jgi:hypothetical protein
MAWSYRRRIKIIPGVHLNLSKKGISTAIGVKGTNLNFGPSGVSVNTGIPMPGIYNRQKHSDTPAQNKPSVPDGKAIQPGPDDNIFSADIQEITSQDMQGVKEAILMAQQQKADLQKDLLTTKAAESSSRFKLNMSYVLLYGLIRRSIANKIKADIKTQQDAIRQIDEQIENSFVSLEVDFDPEMLEKYNRVVSAFKQLVAADKIWDVTSAHDQDRVIARSAASTVISRREVRFGIKPAPHLQSDCEVLYFQNANGSDLYCYPGFIVMHASKDNFALIGIDELIFDYGSVRFIETSAVPPDAEIIDQTWAKVNKNGTPDRRFNGNYQIPIVRYGEFSLQTITGLNEEYKCSNFETTERFGAVFKDYQALIRTLKRL